MRTVPLSVKEMAQLYYPRLWDKARLEALVAAGRLTEAEYLELTGGREVAVQEAETAS